MIYALIGRLIVYGALAYLLGTAIVWWGSLLMIWLKFGGVPVASIGG